MSESFEQYDVPTTPEESGVFRHRSTYIAPTSVSESIFAGPIRRAASMFDPINPSDPEGPKQHEVLWIGDKVTIPYIVPSENKREYSKTIVMHSYEVDAIQFVDGRESARLSDGSGVDEWISAEIVKDGELLEAAIAKDFLYRYNLDLHDSTIQIVHQPIE